MILTQFQIRNSHKNTNAKKLTQDCEFRKLNQESHCMIEARQRRGKQTVTQRERERERERSWRREGQTVAEREEEHQGVRGPRER